MWPHGAARGPGSLSLVLIMTLVLLTFCRTVSLTPPIHHAAAAGKGPAPSVAAEVDQSLTSHRICRRGRGEVPLASEDEPQAEGKERGGAQRRILRGGGRSGEFLESSLAEGSWFARGGCLPLYTTRCRLPPRQVASGAGDEQARGSAGMFQLAGLGKDTF